MARDVQTRRQRAPRRALTAVTVAYLPRNARPVVAPFTLYPPGVVFQRPFVNDESADRRTGRRSGRRATSAGRSRTADAPAPRRRMFQKGLQTIAWKADDADDDQLIYTLQYRREGETDWHDLTVRPDRQHLRLGHVHRAPTAATSFAFAPRTRPSNTPDRALIGERESDPIDVDNTPPTIRPSSRARTDGRTCVTRTSTTSQIAIQNVEYSIGGGAWQLVYPGRRPGRFARRTLRHRVANDAEAAQMWCGRRSCC